MTAQVVPLKCPACGSAIESLQGTSPFGSEIRCGYCGATSLLIVDNNLVTRASLEASGGRICAACGRVGRGEARYCQCGAALVRRCHWCFAEVPAEHRRCDSCGWIDPGVGVMPEIESRWATFIELLGPRALVLDWEYENQWKHFCNREPLKELFLSIWDDPASGADYRSRYIEVLERWPWTQEPHRFSHSTHITFLYNKDGCRVFERILADVGQPARDYLFRAALNDDARGRNAALFLLAQPALDALAAVACSSAAAVASRRTAVDALAQAVEANNDQALDWSHTSDRHRHKEMAFHYLTAIAVQQDKESALPAVDALERVAEKMFGIGGIHEESNRSHLQALQAVERKCPHKDVAKRMSALQKRIRIRLKEGHYS